MLVVAVDPSFFNNNQPAWQSVVFWRLRLGVVAGWLQLVLQAVEKNAFLRAGFADVYLLML